MKFLVTPSSHVITTNYRIVALDFWQGWDKVHVWKFRVEVCLDIFILFLENTLGKCARRYRWSLKVLWFTERKSSELGKYKQVFNTALQEFLLCLYAKESDEQEN